MNIRNDYASWFPKWWLKSGIEDLPYVLQVPAAEFDTSTALKRRAHSTRSSWPALTTTSPRSPSCSN